MSVQKKYTIAQADRHNKRLSMLRVEAYGKKNSALFEKVRDMKPILNDQISIPKSYPCICCHKNKVKILYNTPSDLPGLKENTGMFSGGTVQAISMGFGSKHDMEQIVIALCDECITKLTNKKYILTLP